MSRSVRRIAVVLLLGAALAPGLAVASPAAEHRGATAALGLSWETVGLLWRWLTGVLPEVGSSSERNDGKYGNRHATTNGAVAGRSAPPVRPTEGCSIDPNGRCTPGT